MLRTGIAIGAILVARTAFADDAGAVNLDDITAATATPDEPTVDAASEPEPHLAIQVSAGFGVVARQFSAVPLAIANYSASPIPTATFAAGVRPTSRIALELAVDRTIGMQTAGIATTIDREQAVARVTIAAPGCVDLAAVVGYGHRGFAIDSRDPARSPDADYRYLVAGAAATLPIRHDTVAMLAHVAVEPVIGGAEPTAAMFGSATRFGFEIGTALEVRPIAHLVARVALDLQHVAWSWNAQDSYAAGTVSLGAEY